MSRLFVAVGDGASKLDPEAALRHAEAAAPDRLEIFREPGLVVGVAARWTEPEDEGVSPIIVTNDLVFCVDGRLDARGELAARLGVAEDLSTVRLALELFLRFGREASQRAMGELAWIAVDRRARVVHAARDRFGVRPLHFVEHGAVTAFASTDRLLFEVLDIPRSPDREVIGWALVDAFVSQDGRGLYERVRTLPPGNELELRAGTISIRRYFEPDPAAIDDSLSARQHQARIVDALTLAVGDRVRGPHPIGAECSGGLDSATSVLLATDRLGAVGRPPPLLVHMQATGFPWCDESRQARDVARLVGARIVIADGSAAAFEPGPAPEVDVPDVFAPASRELFGVLAREGVRVVLTGDGSDELQTSWRMDVDDAVARRDPADALRFAGLFDEPLEAERWGKLLRTLARSLAPKVWLSTRHEKLARASLPRWLSEPGRRFAMEARADLKLRAGAFAHASPMRQAICNALVNSPSVTWIGPTNHQFASFHGLDLTYPFLDIRVVEAFLALPTRLRTSYEISKPLHRRAFADRLPPGVLWRRPAANYTPLFEAAYARARDRWISIARHSRLADLGLVESSAFAMAIERGLDGSDLGFPLRNALRLENWLRTFS